MATAPLSTKSMPLPVEIFCAAMQRQVTLADFASIIDIHPDIVQDVLAGRLNSADSDTLNAFAKVIKRDPEQLDLTTVPFQESFGAWLKRNMEGITQHALRARAQLDAQTLKRFLNQGALPDSDQAERISRALYIDRKEIARVVTANMAAAAPSPASQEPPQPKARARQSIVRPAQAPPAVSAELGTSDAANQAVTGTRRRRASTGQASAEPAPSASRVAPTPPESAPAEPDTAVTADSMAAGNRPRRASKRPAQVPPSAAAVAPHRLRDESSAIPAVEAREPDRADGSVATPAAPLLDEGLRPTTESRRSGKPRSRRQLGQAIAPASAVVVAPSTGIQDGRQAIMQEAPAPARTATETEAGTRRPTRSTTRGRASTTAAEPAPTLTETTIAPDDRLAAEDTSPKRASPRRRPRATGAEATDISASGDVSASLAAETSLSVPDQPGADISTTGTAPLVSAELAADTTTFQLSPDEVRLIRHWRQLHPHGRRATLHYIGSLLVDE